MMRVLLLFCFFVAASFAQTTPPKRVAPAPEDAALRAARHSFMMVSTRAIALFQSADTISSRLQSDGSSLHPATITLRLRIERALDQADLALSKGDLTRADEEIKRAGELVNRFSHRIGGD